MQWLNKVVDGVIQRHPEGEIIVESGVSPSGTYHVGTLREVLTCDAVLVELKRRGRAAKHIHYVDDMDPLRKIPVNVPNEYEQYLGQPYCDVPAPDGSNQSYADYFLNDFLGAAKELGMDMQIVRSHERYRSGAMTEALEKALLGVDDIRQIIESVSGRALEDNWAPVQVMEEQYLKNRRFVSIDTQNKKVVYLDAEDKEVSASYANGEVKLNWRVDWPARWWLEGVHVEPFGRDHATKGGSYDTGAEIIKRVYSSQPPYPVPYNFINLTGETKKMSKSSGNIIAISELTKVLPPEVVRYFVFRYQPDKLLFFDQANGVAKLIDDYSQLLAKQDKSDSEQQLLQICRVEDRTIVSRIPFSHLVASYQAALKDPVKTVEVLARTEYSSVVTEDQEIITKELSFIDKWLSEWAPEDVKFALAPSINPGDFSPEEKEFLATLSSRLEQMPADTDGDMLHKCIYELKDSTPLTPPKMFSAIYRAVIGKEQGPRAGWFLSILPREWLMKRLKLETQDS